MKKYLLPFITGVLFAATISLGLYYYLFYDNNSKEANDKVVTNNSASNNQTAENSDKENQDKTSQNTKESEENLRGQTPETISEPTIINGILLANKKHPLPKTYNPGEDPTAREWINKLIGDAQAKGLNISNQVSGFRSYETQVALYNNYVKAHGKKEADTFSARPGYSEHQTGLVFDLIDNQGQLLGSDGVSQSSITAAKWVADNAHNYGYIVRYKPEFVEKTGYTAESWHLRYVGKDAAKIIYEKNISLEDYLNASGGNYIND